MRGEETGMREVRGRGDEIISETEENKGPHGHFSVPVEPLKRENFTIEQKLSQKEPELL